MSVTGCVDLIPTRGNKVFNIFIFAALVLRQSAALSFAAQHAMPPESTMPPEL